MVVRRIKSEAPRRFEISHKTLRLPPEQPITSNKKDSFNRVFFVAMDLRLSVGMEQTAPEPGSLKVGMNSLE